MRALASHQCCPGLIPGSTPVLAVICGLSLLLILFSVPRGFSPGTLVFPSPQKPTIPNSNSIWIGSLISTLYSVQFIYLFKKARAGGNSRGARRTFLACNAWIFTYLMWGRRCVGGVVVLNSNQRVLFWRPHFLGKFVLDFTSERLGIWRGWVRRKRLILVCVSLASMKLEITNEKLNLCLTFLPTPRRHGLPLFSHMRQKLLPDF